MSPYFQPHVLSSIKTVMPTGMLAGHVPRTTRNARQVRPFQDSAKVHGALTSQARRVLAGILVTVGWNTSNHVLCIKLLSVRDISNVG